MSPTYWISIIFYHCLLSTEPRLLTLNLTLIKICRSIFEINLHVPMWLTVTVCVWDKFPCDAMHVTLEWERILHIKTLNILCKKFKFTNKERNLRIVVLYVGREFWWQMRIGFSTCFFFTVLPLWQLSPVRPWNLDPCQDQLWPLHRDGTKLEPTMTSPTSCV